jgi:hypothetical protein
MQGSKIYSPAITHHFRTANLEALVSMLPHTTTRQVSFYYGLQDIKKYDFSVDFRAIQFIPSFVTTDHLGWERRLENHGVLF